MTAVKISGTFSKDERPDNGLEAIAEDLVADRLGNGRWLVVAVVTAGRVIRDPGEPEVPSAKLQAIEVLAGDDIDDGYRLLNARRKARGRPALDGGLAGTLFEPDEDQGDEPEQASEPGGKPEDPPAEDEDLGVNPTYCQHCAAEIHYDHAAQGYLDINGFPAGDGHTHTPEDR